jgi:galactokinase/mevalonate kinase-like predicted kinase
MNISGGKRRKSTERSKVQDCQKDEVYKNEVANQKKLHAMKEYHKKAKKSVLRQSIKDQKKSLGKNLICLLPA